MPRWIFAVFDSDLSFYKSQIQKLAMVSYSSLDVAKPLTRLDDGLPFPWRVYVPEEWSWVITREFRQ